MEKRSSEHLETIASPDLSPSDLHGRTDWHASRGAPEPPRSTREDRRDGQLHNVPPVEPVTPESGGHCGSDAHLEPQASRTLVESPVMNTASSLTSQIERVIPEAPVVGYHLEDPRRDDYATEFRSDSSLQEECEWVDPRPSTPDELWEVQTLNRSDDSSVKHVGQTCNAFPRPLVIGEQRYFLDTYRDMKQDTCFENRRDLHACLYPNGEFLNCPRCPRPVTPLVNFHPESTIPEEYHESCYSRSVANSWFLGELPQRGEQPLRGVYVRGTEPVQCFQKTTRRSASKTHKPQQREEQALLDYPRELADRVVEAMVRTIRAQNDQVDALRADMRAMRSRLARFVATRKKAQDKSLAFIAAVKARMDEHI